MNNLITTFKTDEEQFKNTIRDLLYKKSLASIDDYKKEIGKTILEQPKEKEIENE
jgi:hypothetical protein